MLKPIKIENFQINDLRELSGQCLQDKAKVLHSYRA